MKRRIQKKLGNRYVRESFLSRSGHKCRMFYCYGFVSIDGHLQMVYTARPKRRKGEVVEPEMRNHSKDVPTKPMSTAFILKQRMTKW